MNARFTTGLLVGAALSASCASQTPPETVVPLSDEDRADFFQAAIRNAGLPCEDVLGVVRTSEFGEFWRVSCANATAYLLSVDDSGLEFERVEYLEVPVRPSELRP